MKSALEQEIDTALKQAAAFNSVADVMIDDEDAVELAAEVEKEMEQLHAAADAAPAPKQKKGREKADGPHIWAPGQGEEPKTFLALYCKTDDSIYIHDEVFAQRSDMQLVEVTRGKDGQFHRVIKRG